MAIAALARPVEVASVVERVTSQIRRDIVAGRLAPGQGFSLRQMAAQLEVSFIPVREALRILEAEGLLETRRGRSAVVAPLDLADLRGIFRLCRLIEPDLRVRAARVMRPAELDRLERSLESLVDSAASIDERFERLHTLHADLVRPAATGWDLRIVERLWRARERYVRVGCQVAAPGESDARVPDLRCTRELVAAYRSGYVHTVRKATLRHIAALERIAQRGLELT